MNNHPQKVKNTLPMIPMKQSLQTLIRKNVLPVREGRSDIRKIHYKSAVSFLYRVAQNLLICKYFQLIVHRLSWCVKICSRQYKKAFGNAKHFQTPFLVLA